MKLIAAFFIMVSGALYAETVYKFNLEGNDQIKDNCQNEAGAASSKISMIMDQVGSNLDLHLKVKVCTKSFGFRKIFEKVTMPVDMANRDVLLSILANEQRIFDINTPGKPVVRLLVSRSAMNVGTLAFYKLRWMNPKKINEETMSVGIYVEVDELKFRAFQEKFGTNIFFSRIRYIHKQPLLPSPFILEGDLIEVVEED